ncbi:MAG: hypothetical protein KAT77_00355 [Nanoarchaeota archaeon]|nr:hypothetical protein [Nanoarchaeota archaeon]
MLKNQNFWHLLEILDFKEISWPLKTHMVFKEKIKMTRYGNKKLYPSDVEEVVQRYAGGGMKKCDIISAVGKDLGIRPTLMAETLKDMNIPIEKSRRGSTI